LAFWAVTDVQIADGDLLYRRFDPTDKNHWTVDDSGEGGRLRSGALIWDVREAAEAAAMECSVYQESKVRALGHDHSVCIERAGWEVAASDPLDIRNARRPTVPEATSPFDAIEDEYPDGMDGAHARDAAHAAIVHPVPLSGASRWYSVLAGTFNKVE